MALESFPENVGFPVANMAEIVTGNQVDRHVQELHTQVYLNKGYIGVSDLNEEGLFIDEYSDRSRYLMVGGETRLSACRYIRADKKDGLLSLPTAKHFSIDTDVLKEVAGVKRLSSLKFDEVIEVSALVSTRRPDRQANVPEAFSPTKLLYGSVIRESLDNGYKVWLLNVDKLLLRSLSGLLGKDQVHVLGESRAYMGPPTIPVAINPYEVVRSTFHDTSEYGEVKRAYLQETLRGVGAKYLPKDIRRVFNDNEIDYTPYSPVDRVLRDPRTLAYGAILAYSTARALPAGAVAEFDGSVPLLWGIDVATAVPYTWGLIQTVSAKTTLRRSLGTSVAAGSFMAPYVYFWAEGDNYPPYITGIVAGLIGVGGLIEVVKVRKDHKIRQELEQTDLE